MVRYTVQRDNVLAKFSWVVIGPDGGTAIWRPDSKVGALRMRFGPKASRK
jgi:hypothetical protein